jgi:ABC-type Fe3+-hydroxamate transport system substrate-binding protein
MLFTDHLGQTIELQSPPQRIVSLVPSQSELLWDLGLKDRLAGITKFCIHPREMFESIPRIGGTKTLNIDKIRALKPDLIIGNKEENERSQIEALQKEFTVWMSDIYDLDDALKTIHAIGELTSTIEKANTIAEEIRLSFHELPFLDKSVLYLIWKPYMAAGRGTFIGSLLEKIGLKNVISEADSRYPQLSIDEIRELNPELIFLSSEPFPFKQTHADELQQILPNTKIVLVDGELFSWYGSRLLKSVAYFHELLKQLN